MIGRAIVGLQARKINFNNGNTRTDEEEWFLSVMFGTAAHANLVNHFLAVIINYQCLFIYNYFIM